MNVFLAGWRVNLDLLRVNLVGLSVNPDCFKATCGFLECLFLLRLLLFWISWCIPRQEESGSGFIECKFRLVEGEAG